LGKKLFEENKKSKSNNASMAKKLEIPDQELLLKGSMNYQKLLGVIQEEDPSPKNRKEQIPLKKQATLEFEEFDHLPISHRSSHNVPIIQEPKSNQCILKEIERIEKGSYI